MFLYGIYDCFVNKIPLCCEKIFDCIGYFCGCVIVCFEKIGNFLEAIYDRCLSPILEFIVRVLLFIFVDILFKLVLMNIFLLVKWFYTKFIAPVVRVICIMMDYICQCLGYICEKITRLMLYIWNIINKIFKFICTIIIKACNFFCHYLKAIYDVTFRFVG